MATVPAATAYDPPNAAQGVGFWNKEAAVAFTVRAWPLLAAALYPPEGGCGGGARAGFKVDFLFLIFEPLFFSPDSKSGFGPRAVINSKSSPAGISPGPD